MTQSGLFRVASVQLSKRVAVCKVCKKAPVYKFGGVVCGQECAEKYVIAIQDKAERAKAKAVRHNDKARKEALKSRSDYIKEAQIEFNRFIRARDENLPCISCDRNTGSKVNAGHYLSVGSHPQLRFNEDNCHKQCEFCNTYKSGNQAQYRIRLVAKIGVTAVEVLEGCQTIAKWTVDELKAIKSTYRLKFKELAGKS
jgi:hypothetical protein